MGRSHFEALKGGNWTYDGAVYVCSARRRKGPSVCPHNLVFPIAETDDLVLSVIEGDVLAPSFIKQVLDSTSTSAPDDRVALETERARLVREVENLTIGVAQGGDTPALVAMLKDRDKRLKQLDTQLVPREAPDREALRLALMQRVAEWRGILRANARQGRMVLQQLVGSITVCADERPSWLATSRSAALLVGMVPCCHSLRGIM
jgi:hypothetical protein